VVGYKETSTPLQAYLSSLRITGSLACHEVGQVSLGKEARKRLSFARSEAAEKSSRCDEVAPSNRLRMSILSVNDRISKQKATANQQLVTRPDSAGNVHSALYPACA